MSNRYLNGSGTREAVIVCCWSKPVRPPPIGAGATRRVPQNLPEAHVGIGRLHALQGSAEPALDLFQVTDALLTPQRVMSFGSLGRLVGRIAVRSCRGRMRSD